MQRSCGDAVGHPDFLFRTQPWFGRWTSKDRIPAIGAMGRDIPVIYLILKGNS